MGSNLKDVVKDIITLLILKSPFIGMMLKRTWIYVSNKENVPAWTDGLRIYINPEFFNKIEDRYKPYILAHEIMHIIQKHPLRGKELSKRYPLQPPIIYNIIADAKVNQYLDEENDIAKPDNRITPDHITKYFGVINVKEKSFEEIIEEIYRRSPKIQIPMQCQCNADIMPSIESESSSGSGEENERKEQKEGGEGEEDGHYGKQTKEIQGGSQDKNEEQREESKESDNVLNEGDKEDSNVSDPREIEKRIERKVTEVVVSLKSIGKTPGYAERLLNELLKPKVDWRRLLRGYLSKGLGKKIKRTWTRPSRKYPLFPGKEMLRMQKVVVLVDTSGSIEEKELQQFVSEVYGIAKEVAEVIVVPWDATVYDPIVIKHHTDVKKVKLTGGGGTEILPALKLLDEKFSDSDMIVILSDWHIGDIEDEETIDLLKKYRDRIIAVTTSAEPPEFLPIRIKIQF